MASPQLCKIVLHPPHFFKIILHRDLQETNLMIPKDFIDGYGKFLSSRICLKLPDGLEWNVGLTTSTNGDVWLQNGWQTFSEHYGLKIGCFLVFRFDGNSTFHTIIFDTNGLEIEYDCCNFDDSYENLENIDASFPLPAPKKMGNEGFFSPKIEPEEEEYTITREKPKESMVSSRRSQPFSSKAKKVKAEQNFSNLESEKTGFKVVLGKSTLIGRYNMHIPKAFAMKYMNEGFGTIQVQNLEGRSWSMLYKWSKSHNIEYAYISSGWKNFAQQNHLKEGDIGFFQMIKKDHFVFTLQETSSSPSPSPPISPNINKNSSFKVKFHPKSYKCSVLNIPLTFADNHLSPTMKSAKLVVGNKKWKVKIKHYERCIRFSGGWPNFFGENSLKNGDSCFFKLVSKTESCCVFKVQIFKKHSTSISNSD